MKKGQYRKLDDRGRRESLMLIALLIAGALATSVISSASQNVDIASSLMLNQGWVPYPSYEDRDGWAAFLGEYRENLADDGMEFIGYTWQVITDDDYLAYERCLYCSFRRASVLKETGVVIVLHYLRLV